MYAVRTQNLKKYYKDIRAVDGLDLEIEKGEFFSLLGVNGAGKTTAIKLLSCLVRPTGGDGYIMEKSIVTQANEIKPIINVSPQETAVAGNMSVRENLEFIAGIYGASGTRASERADECIELLRMEEAANRWASNLSGGWMRRLSIAMALITNPQVLFMDEPTLGLDVIARRELWDVIRTIKWKTTVILTTHYLEEAEALSDRIGIMEKGRLMAVGSAAELKALAGADNFEDAFIKLAAGGGEK